MRTRHLAALTFAALALTACGSRSHAERADPTKLDDAASLACDDFANGYKAAQTTDARVDLANKVNEWAQSSKTNGIAEGATILARGSDGGETAWQLAADTFAQSCLYAGWKT
ncbi:hypothetical protein OG866_44340 [Streptomyces sp. NBC_00663]|uniref:hypothetical protein n=1 Tax=Streptomyces sp. NBC_00663 TaxID=2975801 RepID=UPI002E2F503A|nr:hypothetical protein [Streptomyces sp. NBC_00663]